MVELLSPAGSYDSLVAAVNAGADAVYIGGSMFGARAYADNPDEQQLIRGIEYCHLRGRKIYMTVNTLLKEKELEQALSEYLFPYYKNGLDGVIVQDLGVVSFIREQFPDLPVHGSTQMTITGVDGARFLQQQGITRVVPARELSLREVRSIIEETGIEVETFIHGAMCYSYSGQCLLSSMIGGRSGNRGRCAQPCRLPYSCAAEEKRYSGYLLSMKDMCTIDLLPDLIDAGIASMKIEGRMKRPEYTAGVVSIYRKYIDLYQKKGRGAFHVSEEDRRVLMDLYNRGGFSQGYYRQHNGPAMMSMIRPNHLGTEAARIKKNKKGQLQAIAAEPLHQKDVLELPDGSELTISCDIKEGGILELKPRKGLPASGVIYRTKNEYLLGQLQEQYMQENHKVKIKGDLRISKESPAILHLWKQDVSVTVSEEIAQMAKNTPATDESIRKQMNKTGNTPFAFEELYVHVEDGLFIPVGVLNEFRRRGLAMLEEALLDAAGRRRDTSLRNEAGRQKDTSLWNEADRRSANFSEKPAEDQNRKSDETESPYPWKLSILVTDWQQFDAIWKNRPAALDTIYLDSLLFGYGKTQDPSFARITVVISDIQKAGIRCFMSCPPVFREKERALFTQPDLYDVMQKLDGFLIHTMDELSWLKKFQEETGSCAVLAADDNFYTYNRRAAAFLRGQGIGQITLPSELNYRELQSLTGDNTELNVYGHQALMQSAQCVTCNTRGCTKKTSVLWLKDRKHMKFPVLNRCTVCCNTIYNAIPLQLDGCRDDIRQLAPTWLRLSFTVETYQETEQILKHYERVFFTEEGTHSELEGTKGHFRRGVE